MKPNNLGTRAITGLQNVICATKSWLSSSCVASLTRKLQI